VLTCYCLSFPNFLSTGKEDDISLGRIHILVFQEEHAIHAIFLKCREFHKSFDCTNECFCKYEVFLTPNLAPTA